MPDLQHYTRNVAPLQAAETEAAASKPAAKKRGRAAAKTAQVDEDKVEDKEVRINCTTGV